MPKKTGHAAGKAPDRDDAEVEPAPKGKPIRGLRADVIKHVEGLLAGQMRPSQIVRSVDERFSIGARQTHRYIAAIRNTMAAEDDEAKPYHRHYLRASLRTILQRALARDQLSAAVAAVDRIARLDGLYADTKLDVHHSGSIDQRIIDMPREQRRARLNELFSLYAGGAALGDDDARSDDDEPASN